MKKNIGILEYHYHIKFFYTLMRIAKSKDTKVTIFTTLDIFSKLETYFSNLDDFEVVLKADNESLNSFINKVERICSESIDLLFVNTIQETILDLPRFFCFNPDCKMILTIHSVNSWFSIKPEIDFRKLFRSVDTNLSKLFIRLFVLPKFDAINVIYPPIKKYLNQKFDYDKPIFSIPYGFYDMKTSDIYQKRRKDNKFLFVVPGQIEQHRRDYETLLKAFEKIFKKNKENVELILLGYPVGSYGKKILKRCKELEEKGSKLIYYRNFVPEEEYDKVMKSADFLILPISVESSGLGITKEYYGRSKGSAALFEAIQYAKPAIIPANLTIIQDIKSSTVTYKNTVDLQNNILEILNDKRILEKYKSNAKKNTSSFSLKILQRSFAEEILEKIDEI